MNGMFFLKGNNKRCGFAVNIKGKRIFTWIWNKKLFSKCNGG